MPTIQAIIDKAGGLEKVAAAAGTTDWAVRKWSKNGIPEKHWAAIRALADVSIDALHAANERARADAPEPVTTQSGEAA